MVRVLTLLAAVLVGVRPASARFELVDTYVQPEGRKYFGGTLLAHGSRLYVGAPQEAYVPGSVTDGAAYELDLTGVAPMRRIVAPDVSGFFAAALAVGGDTLFVGAPATPFSEGARGAVHAFDVASGAFLRTAVNPDPDRGGGYGYALATGGGRLVVGAPFPGLAPESTLKNVIYVYDLASGTLERTIEDPEGPAASGFGSRLLIAGDFLVASTWREGSPPLVHVFSLATGAYLRTLESPDADHANGFGWSLAAVGSLVAVGAPFSLSESSDHGAVYLIDPATGDVVRTFGSPFAAGSAFGYAVVAVGDLLVVGAPSNSAAAVFDVATGVRVANLTDRSSVSMGGALAATGTEVFVRAYRPPPRGYVVLRFASTCGNGVLDAGELCDDGNLVAGDGCTPSCQPTRFECGSDLGIARASVRVRTSAGGSVIATGRLDGIAEAGIVMLSVAASGARVRLSDASGHALLDLTDLGTPIPGGGPACGPRDGWRTDPGRHRAVYTNRSGALPPGCTAGSAQGLRRLELRRGIAGHRIDVRIAVSGATIERPSPPLDLTVQLGGRGDDVTSACGSRRFDEDDCHGDAAGTALFCR